MTPASVTGTSPATIHAGTSTAPLSQITINLSEPINSVDATAAANYQLRNAGVNGTIGDSDDVIIPLTATYTPGSASILLTTAATLPAHTYRLTIFGTGGRGLHDLAGIVFDGNNDGSAGGDYVRTFAVQAIVGDYNGDNTINSGDYNFWKQNFGATSGPGLRADGNNDGVVDAADYSVWRDAFGSQAGGSGAVAASRHSVSASEEQLAEVQRPGVELSSVTRGATPATPTALLTESTPNSFGDLGELIFVQTPNSLGLVAPPPAVVSLSEGSRLGRFTVFATADPLVPASSPLHNDIIRSIDRALADTVPPTADWESLNEQSERSLADDDLFPHWSRDRTLEEEAILDSAIDAAFSDFAGG